MRDFTYVDDTVRAFIAMVGNKKSIGHVINVGFGEGISVKNLVEMISVLLKKKIKIRSAKERVRPEKSEVMRLVCDNSRAKELLGWTPLTSLNTGLKKVINYIRQNNSYYREKEYAK